MNIKLPEWLSDQPIQQRQTPLVVWPFDPVILSCAVFLVMTGFVMITSASLDVAADKYGSATFYMWRQAAFTLMAFIGAAIVFACPISFWQRWSVPLVVIAGVLLVVVLTPLGREVNGSRRWIGLGIINLQPSEVAKFGMVMFISAYLVRRLGEVRATWIGVAKPVVPLAIFVLLLYLEPDFGALVVLVGTVMGMIFLSGMKASQFFIAIGGVIGLLSIVVTMASYRIDRLKTFLDPWSDAFGAGYQLAQAQIAFGRGEWFGTGLGNSVQKLSFLPEAHTDFVFSILAEETGFIGAFTVLVVYGVMVVRMFRLGRRAEQMKAFFMAYVVYGFAIVFGGQALINIGVNAGALPTKGLTLPLISYGGSSLLVSCAMLAVVLRVDYELKQLASQATSTVQGDTVHSDITVNANHQPREG